MSDFLLVIPDGWTDTPAGTLDLIPAGVSGVESWISAQAFHQLEEAMQVNGLLPENHHVLEARIFNGSELVLRLAIE